MMEDPILSIQDLYPQTIGQGGPITTFILEGTKLKVPEVGNNHFNVVTSSVKYGWIQSFVMEKKRQHNQLCVTDDAGVD